MGRQKQKQRLSKHRRAKQIKEPGSGLSSLPKEMWQAILRRTDPVTRMGTVPLVCSEWNQLAKGTWLDVCKLSVDADDHSVRVVYKDGLRVVGPVPPHSEKRMLLAILKRLKPGTLETLFVRLDYNGELMRSCDEDKAKINQTELQVETVESILLLASTSLRRLTLYHLYFEDLSYDLIKRFPRMMAKQIAPWHRLLTLPTLTNIRFCTTSRFYMLQVMMWAFWSNTLYSYDSPCYTCPNGVLLGPADPEAQAAHDTLAPFLSAGPAASD